MFIISRRLRIMAKTKKNIHLIKFIDYYKPDQCSYDDIKERARNITAMSWHMIIDSDPPKLGIIVSSDNYSFNILKPPRNA